jgi:hypothetical protein
MKYRKEFDQLREKGYPVLALKTAINTAEGDTELAEDILRDSSNFGSYFAGDNLKHESNPVIFRINCNVCAGSFTLRKQEIYRQVGMAVGGKFNKHHSFEMYDVSGVVGLSCPHCRETVQAFSETED